MRLMTVAAAVSAEASVAATETEETNAIAADNDSESESDEEQDNSVNNTGDLTFVFVAVTNFIMLTHGSKGIRQWPIY